MNSARNSRNIWHWFNLNGNKEKQLLSVFIFFTLRNNSNVFKSSLSKSFNFLNYANQIININKSKFESCPRQHVADTVNASKSAMRACLKLQLPVCHPAFNCKKCLLIFNQLEGIPGSIYSFPQFLEAASNIKLYILSL